MINRPSGPAAQLSIWAVLPTYGVAANASGVALAAIAAGRAVPAAPVAAVQPVGSFGTSPSLEVRTSPPSRCARPSA